VSVETTGQYRLFGRLKNKPFWIWNIEEHRSEDFRASGLSVNEEIRKPEDMVKICFLTAGGIEFTGQIGEANSSQNKYFLHLLKKISSYRNQ
jgi:hypothetical protein